MNTTPSGFTAPPPPPPPPPHRAPWRFVRRERGRMIAGVATGMADAFGIDVIVVRVIWVIVAIASFGLGAAAYAICWVAFPSDQHAAPLSQIGHDSHADLMQRAGFVVGVTLLGIGLLVFFGHVFHPFRHGGGVFWATLLIAGGLAILLLRHPEDHDSGTLPPAPWAVPPAPPAPGTEPPVTESGTTPGGTVPGTGASETGDAPSGAGAAATGTEQSAWTATGTIPPVPPTTSAWTQSAPWPSAPRPRVRRRERPRPFLTPITISLLLIGGGVVTLLDNNGTAHLTLAEMLAGALTIVGVALVLSTWFGRARGLLPIGIILLIVTLPAATIDVPLTGGTGNRDYAPVARSELRSKYELGIGRLDVDLTGVPLTGRRTHISARLGIGELVLDVPSTVKVVAHGHAGAGAVRLFGNVADSGWPAQATRTASGTGRGELDLDLRVGAGDIRVRRFEPGGAETILPGVIR